MKTVIWIWVLLVVCVIIGALARDVIYWIEKRNLKRRSDENLRKALQKSLLEGEDITDMEHSKGEVGDVVYLKCDTEHKLALIIESVVAGRRHKVVSSLPKENEDYYDIDLGETWNYGLILKRNDGTHSRYFAQEHDLDWDYKPRIKID